MAGSGLVWAPCPHEGCSADSETEARVVAGLVERLRIYLHHGYVDPEDAEDTFARIESTPAPVPPRILENFRRVFG